MMPVVALLRQSTSPPFARRELAALPVSICKALVVALAAVGMVAAPAACAHPAMLNPLGAVRYLAEQRAGFGSAAHAAALAARADAHAQTLRRTSTSSSSPIGTALTTSAPTSPSFSGSWTALGPTPLSASFYGGPNSGRVDSTAVVQSGPNTGEIFIGTAGGGVWSSTDDGKTWVTHTDQASSGLAIGALAIDPGEPKTIYAGTGEANNCGDCFYGGGVLKSTDGGETWTVENPGGIFSGVDFASLAVDPNTPETVYAATTKGFYISKNGGESWAHPGGAGNFTGPTWGLAIDPATSPSTVYTATSGIGVQKSEDGGESFSTLGGGLPSGEHFGVTTLGIGAKTATHEHGDETLYAAVQLQGTTDSNGGDLSMFKSTDGGTKWTQLSIPAYTNPAYAYEGKAQGAEGDQAWYDNTLAVDPADPEHVLAAGMALTESTDGGSSWSNVNGGGFFVVSKNVLHPDFHALAFATASGDGVTEGEALIGCDGGIYAYDPAKPGAAGVSDLNKAGSGLDTGQLYEDLGVYNDGEKILGGLQDNGTAYFTGGEGWPDVLEGDGGYSAINPLNPEQQFAEADEHLYETTGSWQTENSIKEISPSALINGNFVPPMTIVPNASSIDEPTVYYGGANLWVTHDPTAGSPAWDLLTLVGETKKAVSAIAVAPSNREVVYVGFDDGRLLVTTNAAARIPTFTELSQPVKQWITHIAVDPEHPETIALTFSDNNTQYQSVAPMVQIGAVTLTGTPSASFTNITGNLPSGVSSNSVVYDRGALILATDVGVFTTSSANGSSTTWSVAGSGLPNVQVIGLSLDTNGDIYAATHGRGVWKLAGPAKLSQTITFTSTAPSDATVAGPAYTPTATASSGLQVSFTIDPSSSSICSISGGQVTFNAVGTCTIDANQAGSEAYEAAPQQQQQVTVHQGSQSINFTSTAPSDAMVAGPTYTVTAASTSGLPVQLSIDASSKSICSISGSTSASSVSFQEPGNCVIDANQAGDANYEPATQQQQQVTVHQGSQSINFTSTAPSDAVIAGPTYTPTATASSGLQVSITIDHASSSICSISGGQVSFTAAGSCVIDANQAGDSDYQPAPQQQQSFTTAKRSQTITFGALAPASFDQRHIAVSATASSGLTVSFGSATSSTCSVSGTDVTFLAPGTCTVTAEQAGNNDWSAAPPVSHSFTIAKGAQSVTFTSTAPDSAVVDGSTYAANATSTSGLPVTLTIDPSASSVCSIQGATVSFNAAGTCTIDANQSGNNDWNPATQTQQTVTVGKGSQTITLAALADKRFDQRQITIAATASSGLTVTFTSMTSGTCGVSGTTVTFLATGTCTVKADQAGDSNWNAAAPMSQSFTINKGAQSILFSSAAPSDATAAGTPYTLAATATSGLPVTFTINAASSAVCSIQGATVTFTAAGTCTVEANQSGNDDWNPAAQTQQTFTVAAPPNTVQLTAVKQTGKTGVVTLSLLVPWPGALSVGDARRAQTSTSSLAALTHQLGAGGLLVSELGALWQQPLAAAAKHAARPHRKRKGTPALVKTTSIAVTQAGALNLELELSSAGKAQLRGKRRLSVRVLISFRPTGGTTGSIVRTALFSKAKRRR
jgi:hypothetical protein